MKFRTALYTTIFILAVAMVITIIVFWSVYIINDYRTIKELYSSVHGMGDKVPASGRWTVLVLGISFLTALIGVLSVFFANLLRGNRFKQQQRDFSNMVTHELRLPLSSIQIFAQTLRQRALEPEAHNRFVDGMLSECSRLGFLIDQLLKIQQIEQGKLPVHKVPVESGRFLEGFAGKWHRPLQVHILASHALEADPLLLELALANLVSNAEKYGRGGPPEIELSYSDHAVQFTVRDHARPIDRKDYKRIFQKFYRLANTETKRQTGVGLGLYIVKYIITTLHRGTVQVSAVTPTESRSEGNEFSLRLPAL